jgi:NAD(P)-dependent dehydrogenase (short-subunit alcohol dehydrogenase family)
MIDLEGRVAVVTGAGTGLGRAYALALAQHGARVLVNDIGAGRDGAGSNPAVAERVAAEIVAAGGEAVGDSSTVATPEGGEAIVDHALQTFGGVDILINNAGFMSLSSFAKLDVRTIGDLLQVHLGAAFYVTQPAYRHMMERKRGRIVFTVSGIGAFGIYGAGLYGAAKGGIVGLMNCLELEAERHGIRVNAISPMATTRMAAEGLYDDVPEQSALPELVAPVVVYMASDECAFSGRVWSAGAGSVAELFTARTPGYFKHPESEGPLSAEDIAAHVDAVVARERYSEPPTWPDEWKEVVALYHGRGATE